MPGIMQLRKNFRGGGADMGGVPDSAGNVGASFGGMRGDGDTGSDYGQFARKEVSNIQIAPEIDRAQRNRERIERFARTGLGLLLPRPVNMALTAAERYPSFARTINQYYGTDLPTSLGYAELNNYNNIGSGGEANYIQQAFQPTGIMQNIPTQSEDEDNFDPNLFMLMLRQNLNPSLGIMGIV